MLYVAVALGGVVGAVLRYFFTYWNVASFPFGTLAVNLAGCFVLGGFLTASQRNWRISPAWRTGVGTGVIGSFTTFSTFNMEILQLVTEREHFGWLLALAYMFISLLGGLLLAWGGTVFAMKMSAGRKS